MQREGELLDNYVKHFHEKVLHASLYSEGRTFEIFYRNLKDEKVNRKFIKHNVPKHMLLYTSGHST